MEFHAKSLDPSLGHWYLTPSKTQTVVRQARHKLRRKNRIVADRFGPDPRYLHNATSAIRPVQKLGGIVNEFKKGAEENYCTRLQPENFTKLEFMR